METTGCKIICGAPTTLAVKGLMMMMMKKTCGIVSLCLRFETVDIILTLQKEIAVFCENEEFSAVLVPL